jgi:uncharacterized membrane protein
MSENPPPEAAEEAAPAADAADADAPSLPELVERLEPYVRPGRAQEAAHVVYEMMVAQSHSGPLPSAAEFARYEATLPGAADRIVAMTEREQAHRHDLQGQAIRADIRLKGRGQLFALAALIMSLLVVALLAYWGHATAAVTLGTGVIVAVVALFLGQRWSPAGRSEAGGEGAE